MAENEENREAAKDLDSEEQALETEIDKTLEDTFPASDPPSWTLGTDHRVQSQNEETEVDQGGEAE